ncbi:cadmium-translocating P-type ATPase [Paeniglutamicibacter antarcticus]|uniref:Cadmium-translocating P-type ATPase n=1 Tax=Arthrobacter terrae TaxID=2935737 RepID=A0A931CPH0_9MICC|nr:heavy metal translocating P-type ATPase [Arthrobacter terrae]MBG0740642.1 cadmium-translocating P-type ATPase [Arthrobacter terrae]
MSNLGSPGALLRRYPIIAATFVAGVVVTSLLLAGNTGTARWSASVFALCVAAYRTVGMVRDIAHGRWGVDLLAVTAIVSTVAVGEYLASLIIVLMLEGGAALEDFAAGRARAELSALLDRAPQLAHRESGGGALEDIPAADVKPEDVLLVRPSEVVPVDATLLSPTAVFDESAITGESLPAEHIAGDPVLSGSVNSESSVRLQASAAAADSQYSRIIALVQAAAESRAPVVRLADRYAVPFTVVALVMGALAWLLSGEPARFAEVLVVATPCPLLIAAPVAFLGGMSRAAHAGIIIKNGSTLEQLSRVRTIVLDKTGTLTNGRPALDEVRLAQGPGPGVGSKDDLLVLAAAAEQASSHVLAAAIVSAAQHRGHLLALPTSATEHATDGVTAMVSGHKVAVGKRSFIARTSGPIAQAPLRSGQLAVYVSVDGTFAGTLVMSDPMRPEAPGTLAALAGLGVRHSMMVTGDSQATAAHIAASAGIENVQAECRPEDKVSIVGNLPHRPILMVGDGVNDAPVLAAADVGVAMGAKGSTAASESADVVIMVDDLSRVAQAVSIGQRTMRIAVGSIWIGILLSIALMAAAAVGLIPAVAGALSQEAVDLATILNALRAVRPGALERRKPNSGLSALLVPAAKA